MDIKGNCPFCLRKFIGAEGAEKLFKGNFGRNRKVFAKFCKISQIFAKISQILDLDRIAKFPLINGINWVQGFQGVYGGSGCMGGVGVWT